jgi:hypothetical protein
MGCHILSTVPLDSISWDTLHLPYWMESQINCTIL